MKILLDLFCGAGGCSMGYHYAGFKIIGIDKNPQPNYPFEFVKSDVFRIKISDFNANTIHASPPCQCYSVGSAHMRAKGKKYPDLIHKTRLKLIKSNLPYVIENVIGAPLFKPILLCGTMFNLNILRHRLFESNLILSAPFHPSHKPPIIRENKFDSTKLVKRGSYCSIAGGGGASNNYDFSSWCDAMGIDWMNRKELIEAIPPAYTEYIGKQILNGAERDIRLRLFDD